MCTATSSCMSSVASTPAARSRRNSTSTFSSSLGLAKMLNERGIKAVTPSTLPTPMFSPTATPANSPDHSPSSSPDNSRSPSPSPSSSYSPLGLPGKLQTYAVFFIGIITFLVRESQNYLCFNNQRRNCNYFNQETNFSLLVRKNNIYFHLMRL